MSSEKKCLVAVLPDGSEHFEDVWPFSRKGWSELDYRQVCESAVRQSKMTTSRSNPVPVTVSLYSIGIQGGKLHRNTIGEYLITPTLERMTEDEFDAEMREILSSIPAEFHPYVNEESWDRGHSAGMEECVSIARGIVHSLKPCIAKYQAKWDTEKPAAR